MWDCLCDCGNVKIVRSDHLKGGRILSCGCLFVEKMRAIKTTHGKTGSRAYRIWRNMITRCTNSNIAIDDWNRYGGRGIKVCDRWKNSFEAFLGDMGEPNQGMSLDRFPDVNGDYEPGNCRWATSKEQCNNKRNNHMVEFNGKTMTIAQWAEETGINHGTILSRIRNFGWSAERALTTAPSYNHPK